MEEVGEEGEVGGREGGKINGDVLTEKLDREHQDTK